MTGRIALPSAQDIARETYERQRAAGRSHNAAFDAAVQTFRDCRPGKAAVDAEAATWAAVAPALAKAAPKEDA